MIKAVFFDVGHTLLCTVPSVGEVYAREARTLGAVVDTGELSTVFSRVFGEMAASLAASTVGMRASDDQEREMWRTVVHRVHAEFPALHAIHAETWFERLHDAFGRSDHWTFYPDVQETLQGLRRRMLQIGLISNWSTRLRVIAEETKLASLVDFMIISAEVGVAKPDRRIFELALKESGVAPSEALHVGDLVDYDVKGAQAVGINAALLWRRGEHPPEVDGARVIRDLRELL